MNHWTTMSLAEAGITLIDCDHKTPPAAPHGKPYVGIPQMDDGRLNLADVRLISEEDYVQWTRKALPQPDDIVLSRRCNPGETAYVPEGLEFALGQNLVLLRSHGNTIDPKFLRWLVRGREWWEQVQRYLNVGAVFDSLKCREIPQFELQIPPIGEQRAIAETLGAIDGKIELNRKQNRTLEAIAQALFKHWFVDFEFPDENGNPYKSSGGAMQPSELGEIPVGWKPGQFGDIAKNIKVSADPTAIDPATPYVGLEHIDRKSIGLASWGNAAEATSNKSKYSQGDILFGKLRPYFHKVATAPSSGICSTDILVLNSKVVEFYSFVVWQAFSEGFVEYSNNASTGTRMPRANWKHMADYALPLPPRELGEKFNSVAHPLLEKIAHNLNENRILAEIRDTLLPKLMSGELRVA